MSWRKSQFAVPWVSVCPSVSHTLAIYPVACIKKSVIKFDLLQTRFELDMFPLTSWVYIIVYVCVHSHSHSLLRPRLRLVYKAASSVTRTRPSAREHINPGEWSFGFPTGMPPTQRHPPPKRLMHHSSGYHSSRLLPFTSAHYPLHPTPTTTHHPHNRIHIFWHFC